jgi:protocatechuate 3,4-dioxygenase, alpha subunit
VASEETRNSPSVTVSQTVGPFFHVGLVWLFSDRVGRVDAPGRPISVQGRVLDGDGAPVPDALLEIWQAAPDGSAGGFARVPTNDDGAFRVSTVEPTRLPAPGGGLQAPHLSVAVFMRGLLRQLWTRIYFAGEPSNEQDVVLRCVPEERRGTLIAHPFHAGADAFEWNVVLQGDDETVIFDF